MAVSYPFDPTGVASTNLVSDEPHMLSAVNATPQRLIVPEAAPFHLDNLSLKHRSIQGQLTPLIKDVDYYTSLYYIGASRGLDKSVYGGLTLVNTELQGEILVSYQTIGGPWVADQALVLSTLAQLAYNPRTTVWDLVTNVQAIFPPSAHAHPMDDLKGTEELVSAINSLADTIAQQPSQSQALVMHMVNESNPHGTTKAQIGLGLVQNLEVATALEVTQEVSLQKYVTLDTLLLLLAKFQRLP